MNGSLDEAKDERPSGQQSAMTTSGSKANTYRRGFCLVEWANGRVGLRWWWRPSSLSSYNWGIFAASSHMQVCHDLGWTEQANVTSAEKVVFQARHGVSRRHSFARAVIWTNAMAIQAEARSVLSMIYVSPTKHNRKNPGFRGHKM